ncbi:protein SPMIP7 [Spinachia spinachia]
MATVLDPYKQFSAQQHAIRQRDASGGEGLETSGADSAFARCHGPAEHVNLAPSRDDVPLLDPCCGHLSAGAEVDLGIRGFKEGLPTAANTTAICVDLREDKAWNSRRIPEGVLRARLTGSTDPVKVPSHSLRASTNAMSLNGFPFKYAGTQASYSCDTGPWRHNSLAVVRYRYTSATQRSYEEVCWDTKLPPRLKAPDTTLEKSTGPVSELTSRRRNGNRPQLGKRMGAEWRSQPLGPRIGATKPSSHSEDMQNIDNMDAHFHRLTLKRSIMPPYVPTAGRTTFPGCTGKAADAHSAEATVSVPAVSSPAHSSRPAFGRAAPMSRMVTTVTPCNPFLRQ